MKVLFCKIHCPSFICFCKSSSHIYTPGPLKLENSPHVPSTTTIVSASSDHQDAYGDGDDEAKKAKDVDCVVEGKQQQQQEGEQEQEQKEEEGGEECVKSSLKKEDSDSKKVQKKRVQWMDFLGKELVQIREFEPCEVEDSDDDSTCRKGCVCTIL
ncbi:uncharacterized protein LOC123204102 isoform X2 [Mangifera indica]|uniref:uncharacterized protein LOC123204102 isoform X2 n=1 Tax=Mangifera indica TaxID=29780 RepID=UPI001CFB3F81|nr:uncharacterized protein LOC123204102 isoform X2 [Mangifera indica]